MSVLSRDDRRKELVSTAALAQDGHDRIINQVAPQVIDQGRSPQSQGNRIPRDSLKAAQDTVENHFSASESIHGIEPNNQTSRVVCGKSTMQPTMGRYTRSKRVYSHPSVCTQCQRSFSRPKRRSVCNAVRGPEGNSSRYIVRPLGAQS